MTPRILLSVLGLLVAAAPAQAAKITLGSNLKAPATVVESHPADTAFWAATIAGKPITVPKDGQVVSVKVKGSALREPGAVSPATMVHFQSLEPAGKNGARQVWLTSAPAYLPVDDPGAVSTFEPENLCVHKGGAVAFNTIGGFKWGGSLDAPLDEAHYHNGTPWQIFAPAKGSRTAWYSKDNGTKNGHTLTPAGGSNARDGFGRVMAGRELLMQVVIATGRDRSEPCGGPRRHPDGTLVAPKIRELRVAGDGTQRPYVTKDRRFETGVYCESPDDSCIGRAIMRVDGETIDSVDVKVSAMSSYRVPMRLDPASFRQLDRTGSLTVTYVLLTQFGKKTTTLNLKR